MKKKIKIENQKKIEILKKYNNYYFDKSNPLVSDKKYDDLKKDIINLEKKYNFLIEGTSILNSVGYKPSKNFKKIIHNVPMLSLANAYNEKDLLNFEKKLLTFCQLSKILK